MNSSKLWQIKNSNPQRQVILSNALRIHPIIAQLLINRGVEEIEDARQFLHGDLSQAHDPFHFKGMDRAVARIQKAQERRERILVYGDYDVDGVTSSALLYKKLTQMGLEVISHIPHRVDDGYGLNEKTAGFAEEKKVNLVISVDCGISAYREVELLNERGIDVIIIDHHEPADGNLPKAYAIINPKQKDCPYPFKHLASVGLVAKLIQALCGKMQEDILDMVALGTIADIVPLRGENRIFVKWGLPRIHQTKNLGLAALLEVAKIKGKKINPYSVGFILGPRINATGRMDSAHRSLNLFLSEDDQEACRLAQTLEELNIQRQKVQKGMVEEAMAIVESEVNFKDHKVIVLSKEGWHKGVLGIVASKITEKFYRPTIVISLKDGMGTASARSIDGFHLYEALHRCREWLENYGGHGGAAGLTIRKENIDPFKNLINQIAGELIQSEQLIPGLSIDCEIPLSSVSMDLMAMIDSMQPFGEGNPEPLFCSRRLTVKGTPLVLGKDTLKFWVTDGKTTLSAVGFGMAQYRDDLKSGAEVDLAYEVSVDDWNKAPTVQLKIKDIRPLQFPRP